MKRDMDLIRCILLRVEADPSFDDSEQTQGTDAARLGISDHDDTVVLYHLVQLVDAGMLAGNTGMANRGLVVINKLTWDGHEFLDTIRDNDVWGKTKAAAGKVGGASLAFIWEIAKAEMKTKLGLP